MLGCGFSLSEAAVVAIVLKGNDVDVVRAIIGVGFDSTVLETSFEFWPCSFGGSIVLVLELAASEGTFKTDVVVAVLNVTDVIVVKLAGVDETVALALFLSSVLSALFLLL